MTNVEDVDTGNGNDEITDAGGARWRWSGWWQWRGSEVAAAMVGLWRRGRRVVESGIWDRIDRKARNIIGFAEKVFRRRRVVAEGGGGRRWPSGGGEG
nr:hypothetical protein [Tanacetum cinerariifolium]